MELQNFRHKTGIQIRFNDLDLLGHVNNAVYQHYFDLARMDYFRNVIGEQLDWHSFGVIIASIKIDYFYPVKIFDKISVQSRVDILGDKSLEMSQVITNCLTGKICVQNNATMVGYSALQDNSVSIPSTWKENIFAFEDGVKYKYPV